jgi:pyruvate formate lyase activating enzyme
MENRTGVVTSIQKCSQHDGPGIRTTVFLKGCNMHCSWCHNPETISFEPEILFYPERCIGCGKCDEGCFSGARVLCGTEMTAGEIAEKVLEDKPYYGVEGGVTVSGGEPGCQPEFTEAILSLCEQNGIHTAVETNLSVPFETLMKMIPHCRLVMADLKFFDSELHRTYTGIGNEGIKENIEKLSQTGVPFLIRTPVIKGLNDKDEIEKIAAFLKGMPNLLYYELLPYHPLGLSKGVQREQHRYEAPAKREMEELAQKASSYLPNVFIAGRRFVK